MTHADLVKVAERWLLGTRHCGFCLTEPMTLVTNEIPDAIGWERSTGRSHLVECKTSVSDFYADKRKMVRRLDYLGLGTYRYYMTLPGLLTGKQLPDGWGLLQVHGSRVRVVTHPKPCDLSKTARRDIVLLCSMMRRVYLRGFMPEVMRPMERGPEAVTKPV